MGTRPKSKVRAIALLAAVFASGVLLPAHGAILPTVTSATLNLRLDAAQGVTAGGGAVSYWDDQSASNNDFAQGNVGLQPVLTASQINGLPAIVFTSDRLDAVGTGLNTSSALNFNFFAVTTGASSADGLFDSAPSSANVFRFGSGSGQVELWIGQPAIAAPVNTGGSILSIAANFQSPEGSSRRELSLRSFSSGGVTAKHGFNDTNTQVVFSNPDIGTFNAGAPYFSGGLAEMLIYSGSMTVPDRFAVEQYLREKYNRDPVQFGVPELLPNPVITAASPRLGPGYSQEKAWDISFADPVNPFHTANNGIRADEFVDFDFGAPTLLTQFDFKDANNVHNVTAFNLIFSQDAVFGNGDDIIQSVSDPLAAVLNQVSINGGNGYTSRYVRWDVTATDSDISGASVFAFYTTAVPVPEPATMAVLGLGGLALLKRQRKP